VAELKATALAEVPVHPRPHHGHLPGHLRATVNAGVSRKGNLYLISGGPGARHAHLVEHGTEKMDANPFMGRTIRKVGRSVGRDLKKELGRPL
jgi:HK97 gp10 family phage protein